MEDGWQVLETKRFVIPSLPPSVNSVYQIIFSQRKVEMKPEVRLWKSRTKELVPKLTALNDSFLFKIDCTFRYNFFHKNGKMRVFDSQNLMKVLIDAVAEKNGIGDEWFKFGSWESYHRTGSGCVEVVVSQIKQLEESNHGKVSD